MYLFIYILKGRGVTNEEITFVISDIQGGFLSYNEI